MTQLRADPEDPNSYEDVAWTAPIWFGGSNPDMTPLPFAPGPGPATARSGALVRLSRILPDPAGVDYRMEKIWITNSGTSTVSLAGWTLVDLSGNAWPLSGRIGAGRERALRRNGADLSLNNGGDRLELRNPAGQLVQEVTYGPAQTGEIVRIP